MYAGGLFQNPHRPGTVTSELEYRNVSDSFLHTQLFDLAR